MKFLPHRALSISASLLLLATGSLRAATYTYQGADTASSTNTWSTATNWTGGTNVPGAGDNVIIAGGVNAETVTYDTNSLNTGVLGTLTLTNAVGNGLLTFDIQKTLITTNALAGPDMTIGGASSGAVLVIIDDTYNAVTNWYATTGQNYQYATNYVSANGTLELQQGTVNHSPTIDGILVINGGTVNVDQDAVSGGNSARPNFAQGVTMTSGSINLWTTPSNPNAPTNSAAPSEQVFFGGTGLQMTGGSITSSITNAAVGIAFTATGGQTNWIAGTSSFNASLPIELEGHASKNTNSAGIALFSNQALGNVYLDLNFAGASAYVNILGNSSSAGGATNGGTLNVGGINFTNGSLAEGGLPWTLKLNNNTTMTTNQITDSYSGGGGVEQVDLDGNTLDMTGITNSAADNLGVFAPEYGNTGAAATNVFNIIDSSGNGGTIKAQAIDLSQGYSTSVGMTNMISITGSVTNFASNSAIVLEAVGPGMTNNLGNNANTPSTNFGTISTNSTFYYSPNTTSTNAAYLTSNRAIGGIHVSPGSATNSTLQIIGTNGIIAQNKVQIDAHGILDVNAHTLTITNAVLTGAGRVTSSTSGGVVALTGAGGIEPGSVVGSTTPQQLTLDGTGGSLAVTLASTSVSLFNINSSSSFDSILLGANATLTNAGTLSLDFTSGFIPTNGETFDLINLSGGTDTGSFSAITSNVSGDTFTLNDTTGLVTVATVVPEPSSVSLILGALFVGGIYWRLRRSVSGRLLADG